MFKKLKAKKQERANALQIMIDFAEGRMATEEFWDKYKNNSVLQDILVKDKTRPIAGWKFDLKKGKFIYNKRKLSDEDSYLGVDNLLKNLNIAKLYDRQELFRLVLCYFARRKIELKIFNKDRERYGLLVKMQPDWLSIQDEDFLLDIYNSAPEAFSKAKKLSYCKEKINELFKYDKKPPEWEQNPEWPIINGKPLVFSHQEMREGHGDHVFYCFYNPETKQETVIEQYT